MRIKKVKSTLYPMSKTNSFMQTSMVAWCVDSPGHSAPPWHGHVCLCSPRHSDPLCFGSGLLQSRPLLFIPVPHVTEQSDQSFQRDQPPLTEKEKERAIFSQERPRHTHFPTERSSEKRETDRRNSLTWLFWPKLAFFSNGCSRWQCIVPWIAC